MSQSDILRRRGNEYYHQSVTSELSPDLQTSRLGKARQLYIDALESSSTAKERASANKNLAMTSWKLARLGQDQKERLSKILFYYKEALKYFGQALTWGSGAGNEHCWSDSLVQKMYQSLQESLDFVNDQPYMINKRFELVSMACDLFPAGEFKAETSIRYVELLLRKAINFLHEGVFNRSKSVLGDCYRPLEIARRYGRYNRDIIKEVDVCSDDVTMQMAVVEAKQALITGDDLKVKILMTEEELNINMVWEVIDWYKKAILLTRELDVETEAIANSRIGVIYDRILKLNYRARPYFKNAITLAHSLHPRILTNEGWYKVCEWTLKSYQIQTVAEETAAWMKDRDETMKKIEPQLDKFKNIKDNYECLKYIYKNHPPTDKKQKLPDDLPEPSKIEQKQIKKLLQKAIIHYHPDHNTIEKHGKEWHVLCEEITKIFTSKYNLMKGVDA